MKNPLRTIEGFARRLQKGKGDVNTAIQVIIDSVVLVYWSLKAATTVIEARADGHILLKRSLGEVKISWRKLGNKTKRQCTNNDYLLNLTLKKNIQETYGL